MSYETITYEKNGPIATVTFNRPEKHNPWSVQVSEEIVEVFTAMEADPEVLVTVLTGKGNKAFSAGADLANPRTKSALAQDHSWARRVFLEVFRGMDSRHATSHRTRLVE